ncbi:MAG: 3-hydroxyacyl-CoA dehydrogenase NAD-binding domain-containing protein [Gammaproteobacteria bacterium]
MHPHWSYEIDSHQLAWLAIDHPESGTNTLSRAVIQELGERIHEIAAQSPRGLVIYSKKKNGFIAGADIKEFTTLKNSEEALQLIRAGQRVYSEIENLPFPTLVILHGFAMGGGLELALACRYRLAVRGSTRLGLPEVKLGIHPGFGGTVRSVRLLGVQPAMRIMLRGEPIHAEAALKMGLVDRLIDSENAHTDARDFLLHPPAPHRPPRLASVLELPLVRPWVARRLRDELRRHIRQEFYPAPYAIVALWERFGNAGTPAHYEAEAHSIANLMSSPTARNLVRVFLLQDRLKGLGKKSDLELKRVHVIGAGVMGGDIAAWCALRGYAVSLQDREARFVEPALIRARKLFERRLHTPGEVEAAVKRLEMDLEGQNVSDADVVIEAIFENPDAKKTVYASIEPKLKPGALLATNTSSIRLERLSADLDDPGRLVGIHFFNPVAKMPLVEIVQTAGTHAETIARALSFARQIERLPVPVQSAPGFLVNRVLMPYLMEAMLAGMEGIPYESIDEAALLFGMPMGPVELADTVGLDVALSVAKVFAQELNKPVPELLETMVQAGTLGKKTGRGFYRYRDGHPVKDHSRASLSHTDLKDRLILPLLNEVVACRREKIVDNDDLIDAGVIFGTGFAPFRGGPLQYIRETGPQSIYERLQYFEERLGERFSPDPGWQDLLPTPPT